VVPSSLYATSSYGGIGEVGYRVRKSLIAFLVLFQKSMKSDSVTSTILGLRSVGGNGNIHVARWNGL
jgi:hypothetical protein